jgi:DNA repair exonuclease SbcCD ATPase subunit
MEEAAHFLIEGYSDQETIDNILATDEIMGTEEWSQYSAIYTEIYAAEYEGAELENKVKREILGKILTKQILSAAADVSVDTAVPAGETNIFTRIRDLFGSITEWLKANLTNQRTELDSLVENIRDSAITGDPANFQQSLLDNSNIGVLYSVGDYKLAKHFADRNQRYNANIANLRRLHNAVSTQVEGLTDATRRLIKDIDGRLQDEYDAAENNRLHEVLNGWTTTLEGSVRYIDNALRVRKRSGEVKPDYSLQENIRNAGELVDLLKELRSYIVENRSTITDADAYIARIESAMDKFNRLESDAVALTRMNAESFYKMIQDRWGISDKKMALIRKIMDAIQVDVSIFSRWFGTLEHNSSVFNNILGKLISKNNFEAVRNTQDQMKQYVAFEIS